MICPICNKEFIKTHPRQRFCNGECRIINKNSMYMKEYRAENKAKTLYYLSIDEIKRKYRAQDKKCMICLAEVRYNHNSKNTGRIDHNHKTGQVRGILCQKCNLLAGHVENDWELLLKCKKYVVNWNLKGMCAIKRSEFSTMKLHNFKG